MTVQEAIEFLKGGCLMLACEYHLQNRCNNDYEGRERNKEEALKIAIKCMKKVEQYRALGTVEELKEKLGELERWHTDRINENIKNEFANKSTLICHNCDHKDEYIEDLESEIAKQLKEDWRPYTVGGERPCGIQKVWISFSNELCSFVKQAWWVYDHFEWNNGKRVKDYPLAWMPYIVPQPHKKEGAENAAAPET